MPNIDLSVLDNQIAAAKLRLAEARKMATKEKAKLDALTDFRKLIGGEARPIKNSRQSSEVSPESPSPKKLKPSAAVLELLNRNPDGLSRLDIVDAVTQEMDSMAAKPRHIVRTTLFNMKKSGRIVLDEGTGLFTLPK